MVGKFSALINKNLYEKNFNLFGVMLDKYAGKYVATTTIRIELDTESKQ
jgi:hypothetical protein